jgi:hypothetical protein
MLWAEAFPQSQKRGGEVQTKALKKHSQHFPGRLRAAIHCSPFQQAFCKILHAVCFLYDLVHVPGVWGKAHLDNPSLPASASCLEETLISPIRFRFLWALSISSCVISAISILDEAFLSFQ